MSEMERKGREIYVMGLRNAHAMEVQAIKLLSRQIGRVENYPELLQRLQEHLEESKVQRDRLEEVLENMKTSHSTMKDTMMGMVGNLAALGHAPAADEVLKNNLANLAFEHYEIAAYKTLITIADMLGQDSAKKAAEASLKEEQAMAQWVDEHIAPTVTLFLTRLAAGDKASR